MTSLYRFNEKVSRGAARIGGGLLLLDAAAITIEVVLRKIFNISFGGGSEEVSGYILAISVSWGLSLVLLRRGHVRIDALYMRVPRRATAWLDFVSLASLVFFMAFVVWFSIERWLDSMVTGSTSSTTLQTPLAVPQGLWIAGFALFMFTLLLLLGRVARMLAVGDLAGIRNAAGIRSVEEEISEEVSAELLANLQKRRGVTHVD